MIRINETMMLEDRHVQERFVRAVGPGGRNPTREATAVEIRVDTRALPLEVRRRLRELSGARVTTRGMLVVTSRVHDSQTRNREAARARLLALLDRAATPPRERRPTGVAPAAREQRLAEKKLRGAAKRARRGRAGGDD